MRHLGAGDLGDLPPQQEAVVQRIQFLTLWQLVGGADLQHDDVHQKFRAILETRNHLWGQILSEEGRSREAPACPR